MRRRTPGLTSSRVILRRMIALALMRSVYDAPSPLPSATAAVRYRLRTAGTSAAGEPAHRGSSQASALILALSLSCFRSKSVYSAPTQAVGRKAIGDGQGVDRG